MAKTLKLNVSFPMTIVASAETVKDLQESRAKARELPDEKLKGLYGEAQWRIDLYRGDRTDEELMELIYRAGIREFIKKDFVKELAGTESRIRVGDVKVTFETPEVPARKCELHDDRKACTSLCARMLVTQ